MKYLQRRSFERKIEKALTFLSDQRFKKRRDHLKEYSGESMIHYLQLDNTTYLVANHYACKKSIELQGFDLWLSEYDRASDIGEKEAISKRSIKLSMKLPEDQNLLLDEINRFAFSNSDKM